MSKPWIKLFDSLLILMKDINLPSLTSLEDEEWLNNANLKLFVIPPHNTTP